MMDADNQDRQGTPVSGVVTRYYASEGEKKPHAFYVKGKRYTSFEDADVAEIEEGVAVRFRYVQNGKHRNVVPGSVAVIDDAEADVYGSTDCEDEPFSPTDARIGSQSVLRSAVLHHQHREDSTGEDVVATAEMFADAQVRLSRKLRNTGKPGEA